jgi:hypothetical protein
MTPEVFSELDNRKFPENLEIPEIHYFTYLRKTRDAKKIPKTVLKPRLKRNHINFSFQKILCSLFPKPLNKSIFSVFGRFIEDNQKTDSDVSKLSKNRRFFSKDKIVLGSVL